jgi:hypothetical protein
MPFHYGLDFPLSTFFASTLSVEMNDESMSAFEIHLKEGSNEFYSVTESSPSLTGGSTNRALRFYGGVNNAYFPRYMSMRPI